MIDLSFMLQAGEISTVYRWPLWRALTLDLPWLASETQYASGVHALKLVYTGNGLGCKSMRTALLTKRTRLVLRLPQQHAQQATDKLFGRTLKLEVEPDKPELAGHATHACHYELALGQCIERPLQEASTLYADCVTTGSSDETKFIQDIEAELEQLGISCHMICGSSRQIVTGQPGVRALRGFALALHDLSLENAILIQSHGLGKERRFGCGIFVPHKSISGL